MTEEDLQESAEVAGSMADQDRQYWPHGAVERVQFGNGLWEWSSYNDRLQPADMRLGTSAGGSEKWRLRNNYEPSICGITGSECNNGNVWFQTLNVPALTQMDLAYTYDNVNRLTSAAEKQNTVQQWAQGFSYL